MIDNSEINILIDKYVEFCGDSGRIDQTLYQKYDVKRGLRDSDGKGVLTGLTEISDVNGFKMINGERTPIDGELYFQGYNVKDLVEGFKEAATDLRKQYFFCSLENSLPRHSSQSS